MSTDISAIIQPAASVAAAKPQPDPEHAKAVKATQDFEAVFIGMMLKQMRKSMAGDNALFGNSNEARVYQDMMDDNLARELSRTGTFGLAKAMMKSIDRTQHPAPAGGRALAPAGSATADAPAVPTAASPVGGPGAPVAAAPSSQGAGPAAALGPMAAATPAPGASRSAGGTGGLAAIAAPSAAAATAKKR
ncbi:MAG TPA: rod-binding protein [Chthonomonadaceae bacterium]|nr:rod-binding protein [Chthonomonadaceae bacterium]